jgi:hypothetical protein
MTVRELMHALSAMDPDQTVVICGPGWPADVEEVVDGFCYETHDDWVDEEIVACSEMSDIRLEASEYETDVEYTKATLLFMTESVTSVEMTKTWSRP